MSIPSNILKPKILLVLITSPDITTNDREHSRESPVSSKWTSLSTPRSSRDKTQELWRGSGEQEGFIQMSFVCTQTGGEVSKADVSSLLIPDLSL